MKKGKKIISSKQTLTTRDADHGVLERFMKEFFPFSEFRKIGFFAKKMKGDYNAQAKRVCDFFGFKTVYEYGAKEMRVHISYANGKRSKDESFITVMPSIYDSPLRL